MRRLTILAATAAALLTAAPAAAGVILQPKSVTVVTGGTAAGYDITNLINQSGLSKTYIPGVTDFDTYVAAKPLHAVDRGEWLSAGPTTSARITFDFGELVEITGFALWNEDSTSMRFITARNDVGSFGGFSFLDPSPLGQAYGPTVKNHQLIRTRTITFDIAGCNAAGSPYNGCGIGEVIFNSTKAAPPPGGAVPEPGAWALMIMGFLGAGSAIRRQRARPVAA